MIIKEILALLEAMCGAYNSESFDFTPWHNIPMAVVEDSNFSTVEDHVIFSRVLETIVNCNKHMDLPVLSFQLHHFMVIGETVVTTKVVWNFSEVAGNVGAILELGYVFQKKNNIWKIISVLQPTWRKPFSRNRC